MAGAPGGRNPSGAAPSARVGDQPAITVRLAKRLRATSAAAAAPNSSTIGGAGTGAGVPPVDPVPPFEPPLLPPFDDQPPFELQPPLLLQPLLLDP